MSHAEQTFDIFALNGTAFANNHESLGQALRRGVNFRVVLFDHGPANRANLEAYLLNSAHSVGGTVRSTDNSRQACDSFRVIRDAAKVAGKGTLELRLWTGTFLNSFWVRDGHSPTNALAHTEVTFYGDGTLNPSVRYGSLSPQMVASFQGQFDHIWDRSSLEGAP